MMVVCTMGSGVRDDPMDVGSSCGRQVTAGSDLPPAMEAGRPALTEAVVQTWQAHQ